MLDPVFEKEIIKHLGDGRRPEELVAFVCERTGLKWDAAKEEILRVKSIDRETIVRRRTWILFWVWIPTLIAGTVATACVLLGVFTDPLRFAKEMILHPHSLVVLGIGILAFGGSLAVFFLQRKPPK